MELPIDLDLCPHPQTHLSFGCCTVRVTWKPTFPDFQKKSSPFGLYIVLDQDMGTKLSDLAVIALGLQPGVRDISSNCHVTEGGCPPSWRPGVLALGCSSRLNGQIFVGAIRMQLKIRLRTCGWRLCPPNLFVPCHKAFVATSPPMGTGEGGREDGSEAKQKFVYLRSASNLGPIS